MDPPGPRRALPDAHPLFAREDWPLIRRKTRALAYKVDHNLAVAQDIADAAIFKCIDDPNEPWKLGHKQLVKWIAYRVARIAFHQHRHDATFQHAPIAEETEGETDDATYTVGHILHGTWPTPEQAVLSAEAEGIYRRRLDALARRVADDPLVSLLVREVREGSDSPMATALAEGYASSEVYFARRRLERAAHAVLDEEQKREPKPPEEPPP